MQNFERMEVAIKGILRTRSSFFTSIQCWRAALLNLNFFSGIVLGGHSLRSTF